MLRTSNSFTTSDSGATTTATTYGRHWLLIFHWILPSCKRPFSASFDLYVRSMHYATQIIQRTFGDDMELHIYHHHHHLHHQRLSIQSWQRNPSLDWSYRCLCLANLDHKGPICLVRLSLHLVFGRPCILIQSAGVHSVDLMLQRLPFFI